MNSQVQQQTPPAAWHHDALIRRKDVIEGTTLHPPLLRVGVTKFHDLVKSGSLPRPVHIGKAAFWRAGDMIEAIRKLGGAGQ